MTYETMRHLKRTGQRKNTFHKTWRNIGLLLTLLLVFTSAALCQLTTADILGTVTDASGAVVPMPTAPAK